MKNILILLFGLILLVSCSDKKTQIELNTKKTLNWIEKNKKPIYVRGSKVKTEYANYLAEYTLQSSDNKFLYTGVVSLNLPEFIVEKPKQLATDEMVSYDTFLKILYKD